MTAKKYLLFLIIFILVERIIVSIFLPPFIFPDTKTYMEPAVNFLNHGNFGDMPYRTPGYPFFLCFIYSIINSNQAVVIIQHIISLLSITLLIKLVKNDTVKIIAAAFILMDMQLPKYEHSMLPDLLFTAILILAVYFFKIYIDKNEFRYLALVSFSISVCMLIKPVLIFYPAVIAVILIFYFISSKHETLHFLKALLVFMIPVLLTWSLWSYRNYKIYNYFGFTLQSGPHFAGITEEFMDFESPLHSDIKNLYKKYTGGKIKKRSLITFKVLDELKNNYGYTDPKELNSIFMDLNKEALSKNFSKFLVRGLRESFYFFFTNNSVLLDFAPDNYGHISENIRKGNWKNVIMKFLLNFYVFYWFFIAIFFVSALKFIIRFFTTKPDKDDLFIIFLLSTILYITVISVFLGFGLGRYRMSVQGLMTIVSAYGFYWIIMKLRNPLTTFNEVIKL